MRFEDRTGVMCQTEKERRTPRIICICETEDESLLVDKLGKIGSKVVGELCLADGYGEFYIRLEPAPKNKGKAIELLEEIKAAAGKSQRDVFYYLKAEQALVELCQPKCKTCGGSGQVDDPKAGNSNMLTLMPCPDCQSKSEEGKGFEPRDEPTDKTQETSALRPEIYDEDLNLTIRRIQQKLADRLNEKGAGAFVSRHEILGSTTEEYDELIKAVHKGSIEQVADELADLAVGSIFACTCIWAQKIQW